MTNTWVSHVLQNISIKYIKSRFTVLGIKYRNPLKKECETQIMK
jgi:hypothetical protein